MEQLSNTNKIKISQAINVSKGYLKSECYITLTANPFFGCLYGCKYCYVPKGFRFLLSKEIRENWGKKIIIKENFLEKCDKYLKSKFWNKNKQKIILRVGTSTDPFQPDLEEWDNWISFLENLSGNSCRRVIIQTKSTRIKKYAGLISNLSNCGIIITINTENESIRKDFETKVPTVQDRIKAVKYLVSKNIDVAVMISPILINSQSKFLNMLPKCNLILKTLKDDGANGKRLREEGRRIFQTKYPYLLDQEKRKEELMILSRNYSNIELLLGRNGFLSFLDKKAAK